MGLDAIAIPDQASIQQLEWFIRNLREPWCADPVQLIKDFLQRVQVDRDYAERLRARKKRKEVFRRYFGEEVCFPLPDGRWMEIRPEGGAQTAAYKYARVLWGWRS